MWKKKLDLFYLKKIKGRCQRKQSVQYPFQKIPVNQVDSLI